MKTTMKKRASSVIAVAACLIGICGMARADVTNTNTSTTYATIQAAIDAAVAASPHSTGRPAKICGLWIHRVEFHRENRIELNHLRRGDGSPVRSGIRAPVNAATAMDE